MRSWHPGRLIFLRNFSLYSCALPVCIALQVHSLEIELQSRTKMENQFKAFLSAFWVFFCAVTVLKARQSMILSYFFGGAMSNALLVQYTACLILIPLRLCTNHVFDVRPSRHQIIYILGTIWPLAPWLMNISSKKFARKLKNTNVYNTAGSFCHNWCTNKESNSKRVMGDSPLIHSLLTAKQPQ